VVPGSLFVRKEGQDGECAYSCGKAVTLRLSGVVAWALSWAKSFTRVSCHIVVVGERDVDAQRLREISRAGGNFE